jgi:hypothetical protein
VLGHFHKQHEQAICTMHAMCHQHPQAVTCMGAELPAISEYHVVPHNKGDIAVSLPCVQDAAEIIARKTDWPALYDEAAIENCKVPTAALSELRQRPWLHTTCWPRATTCARKSKCSEERSVLMIMVLSLFMPLFSLSLLSSLFSFLLSTLSFSLSAIMHHSYRLYHRGDPNHNRHGDDDTKTSPTLRNSAHKLRSQTCSNTQFYSATALSNLMSCKDFEKQSEDMSISMYQHVSHVYLSTVFDLS